MNAPQAGCKRHTLVKMGKTLTSFPDLLGFDTYNKNTLFLSLSLWQLPLWQSFRIVFTELSQQTHLHLKYLSGHFTLLEKINHTASVKTSKSFSNAQLHQNNRTSTTKKTVLELTKEKNSMIHARKKIYFYQCLQISRCPTPSVFSMHPHQHSDFRWTTLTKHVDKSNKDSPQDKSYMCSEPSMKTLG